MQAIPSAGGRVIVCLEGGYNLRAIASSASAIVRALLLADQSPTSSSGAPTAGSGAKGAEGAEGAKGGTGAGSATGGSGSGSSCSCAVNSARALHGVALHEVADLVTGPPLSAAVAAIAHAEAVHAAVGLLRPELPKESADEVTHGGTRDGGDVGDGNRPSDGGGPSGGGGGGERNRPSEHAMHSTKTLAKIGAARALQRPGRSNYRASKKSRSLSAGPRSSPATYGGHML